VQYGRRRGAHSGRPATILGRSCTLILLDAGQPVTAPSPRGWIRRSEK
jgi:hypothetical protein